MRLRPISGPPASTHPIQLLPDFLSVPLQLSAEQRKQIDDFETDASAKFEKSLSDDQRTKLKDLQKNAGPYGADFAGLVGKDLTPGKTIEELEARPPVAKK